MKITILSLIFLFTLSFSASAQQPILTQLDSLQGDWVQGGMEAGSILVCMGDKVNMREKGEMNGKTVGSIQYGDRVEVLAEPIPDGEEFVDYGGKEWLKVRTIPKTGKPIEGYVYSSFLARGAWELKEGKNRTVMTLGLPYGPNEKHSPVILRLRGARNMDIGYHPDERPGQPQKASDYSLSSISLMYEGTVSLLEDGELLIAITDLQCACGCYGKSSYFLVGNVGKGYPIMTGEVGQNEGYRKTIYPMLEDGNRFIGLMQEETLKEYESSAGYKEFNIYYFEDAADGGLELSDHVNFSQQYTVDEEGKWKQK